MRYDDMGREMPDDTPVEMPVGMRRPQPLNELVKELIRNEMSRQAADVGQETFDEANDFDVEDDDFPSSQHELLDDEEFRSAEQNLLDRAAQDMHNEDAANKQRKPSKGDDDEKVGDSGSEHGVQRAGADGEVGSKVGVEGRPAAKRGG